jgi:uncharacterized protein
VTGGGDEDGEGPGAAGGGALTSASTRPRTITLTPKARAGEAGSPAPGRRASAKPHPRVFAFDDAPFHFGQATTPVVGLSVALPGYVEGVLRTEVEVDGLDATDRLVEAIAASRHRPASTAILLGGISFGGFNLVDLDALAERCGLPVVTVTRDEPDLPAMKDALARHLPSRPELARLLTAHPLFPLPLRPRPLWVAAVGISREEAELLLRKSLVRGSFPEPLRLAHLFASAIPAGPTSRSRA